jgi:hypothetical protein
MSVRNECDRLENLLVDGLLANDSKHKQWCLERALEALVGEARLSWIKVSLRSAGGEWEPGVRS